MYCISGKNVSNAWIEAVDYLINNGDCNNLMVSIDKPLETEEPIHTEYNQLLANYDLRTLKQVTYTVFPESVYQQANKNRHKLFDQYNRPKGIYDRLLHQYKSKFGWGSYFRRMTHYPIVENGQYIYLNQLEDIITMLNERPNVYKAAYSIVIPIPGKDCRRVMGGPCLHYITLQLSKPRTLNFLAVYRNHDFIQRAYGNYISLGYLMDFICNQTGYTMGKLHCLSSNASIANLGGARHWPSIREIRGLIGSRIK
jgi:thymidylate synthase